jgi:hypothetical protein
MTFIGPQGYWYGCLPDERIHIVDGISFHARCGAAVSYAWIYGDPLPEKVCEDCKRSAPPAAGGEKEETR